MEAKPESTTSPNEAAIPIANSRIARDFMPWWLSLGRASFEIRITPSVSVVRARHLRMCRSRPRIITEKVAVVKTWADGGARARSGEIERD